MILITVAGSPVCVCKDVATALIISELFPVTCHFEQRTLNMGYMKDGV